MEESTLCIWFRATDAVSLIGADVAVKNRTGSSALMRFFRIFSSLHQSCESHKKKREAQPQSWDIKGIQ